MDREILLVAERGADDELAEEGCGRDLLLGDGLEAIAATVSPRLACSQPPALASLHTAHAPCSLPLRPLPQRLFQCSRLCYNEPFQRFRLCYDEPLSMFPAVLRRTVTINYLISFYTTIIHPFKNRLAPFSFKTSPISTAKGASYNTQRLAPFTIQNRTTCSFFKTFYSKRLHISDIFRIFAPRFKTCTASYENPNNRIAAKLTKLGHRIPTRLPVWPT